MREDPARMEKVSQSSMQASYIRGNQRSSSSAAQLGNNGHITAIDSRIMHRHVENKKLQAQGSIAELVEIDSPQNSVAEIEVESFSVVRGERVFLRIKEVGPVVDITWRAFSASDSGSGSQKEVREIKEAEPHIEDYPIEDTVYYVRYHHAPSQLTKQFRIFVEVLDNPEEPSSALRLVQTGSGKKDEKEWYVYEVSNTKGKDIDNVYVQVAVEEGKKVDEKEAAKYAPNTTWNVFDGYALMDIGTLKGKTAATLAIAFSVSGSASTPRARVWSASETNARAPTGVKIL